MFAVYRLLLAGVTFAGCWRAEGEIARMGWLRRRFLTGFIVTVPLIVSVVALVWIFRFVDDVATPVSTRVLGRAVPGLGVLVTALVVLAGRRGGDQRDRPAGAERGRKLVAARARCSRQSTRR